MNQPSLGWLQQLNAQLQAGQPANEYPTLGSLGGMPATPVGLPPPPPVPVNAAPPPSPAAPNMSLPTDNPNALMSQAPPQVSQGPTALPVGVEPPTPKPPARPDVEFARVGGGVIPEHEGRTRGPVQEGHMLAAFEPQYDAINSVGARSQMQAEREQLVHDERARASMRRQEAAERVQVQRARELEGLAMDYEDSVQKLGQAHLDDNRWWAKKTTGDKIGTIALAFLGGLGQLAGGENLAYKAILKEADDDIEAQKFDYKVGLDQANGAQNAYSMALERYKSDDAATAVARAAALDYAQARVDQMKAEWTGTEAANQADMLKGMLFAEREKTIASGFKFIPSTVLAPRFQMSFRGQVAPGTFSENEAQAKFLEHGIKPGEQADQKLLEGDIQMGVNDAKAQAERAAKSKEHAVTLPNGETVAAPSDKEAETLRGLSVAVSNAQQLVNRAKQIRSDASWAVSPTKYRELQQIQAELVLAFKDRGGLGALSGPDMDLARSGIGSDLTSMRPGVDLVLDNFATTTGRALQNRVKTIPGAPANASGKLSDAARASFQAHGKK